MFDGIRKLKLAIRMWGIFSEAQEGVKKEVVQMDGKKWYTSKTIWWNIFSGVSTAVVAVVDSKLITDPRVLGTLALVNTIVNVVLRSITSEPVTK